MKLGLQRGSRVGVWALLFALGGCSPSGGSGRPSGSRDAGTTEPMSDSGPGNPVLVDVGPRPDTGPPRGLDSDGDGIPDDEEIRLGTDPHNPDTDGDGVPDGVEILAGTDPLDPNSTIPPTDFYVVLPFEAPTELRELDFTARLGRADIFFLVDTTGSMGAAIGNVRSSLSTMIVPAINDAIVDSVMGVGDYRDFPVAPYGDPGDWPFIVRQEMTDDVSRVQSALNGLRAGGGNDGPESTVEALYRAVSGGCPDGFGEACFRFDSHPIIVVVTDAEMHNGPGGANAYSGVTARTWTEMVAALNAHDVKIVGAAVDPISIIPIPIPLPNAARPHLEALATATSSRSAAGSLTVYNAPGGSVSGAVVDGILDLVGAARQDVTSRTLDDESDAVDARRFIQAVRPLRATRATSFDATTFYGVGGGTTITFEVAFRNDFLPEQTFVQIFRAYIEVFEPGTDTVLDRRNVYVVVPAVGGVLI